MIDKIVVYEKILSLTQRMLENARRGQWEDVAGLEGERQSLLSQIIASEKSKPQDSFLDFKAPEGEDPDCEADLIRKILVMDGEISGLVERDMAELHQRFREESKILQAYGSSSNG